MHKALFPIVAGVGFLAAVFLYLTGLGYQKELLDLGQAFGLMRYCAYAGLVSVGLVVLYVLWRRPTGIRLGVLFLSSLLGLGAFYMPYRQQLIAASVPRIHDITTNIENPPLFVAVLPLRASAPNSAEYAGVEVGEMQREAYPDIRSIVYIQGSEEVFEAALKVVGEMDWQLVEGNLADGRIEATATTKWFGFKDDVVLRVSPGAAGSSVFDMRSKSRVGRSDVGANAARIRRFTKALNEELSTL